MSWSSYTHIIHRRAAEQIDPPSRLGQVNEVMRFCVVKKPCVNGVIRARSQAMSDAFALVATASCSRHGPTSFRPLYVGNKSQRSP